MKAVQVRQFGGPEVCQVESDVPVPVPTAGQIRISVRYAGINPVDTYIRSGAFFIRPDLPYTPGVDCAGIIDAVGSDIKEFKVGDRVYTRGSLTGTYAEYTLAEPINVFPLHESLSFAQGARTSVPYCTAYRSLFHKANAKSGMTVLVHGGSGGVGLATIQIARAYGMTVLATAGTESGLQLVLREGAHAAFCHREEGYQQKITAYTGGKGVDVIVEMAADINLQNDLTLLAPNGKVVVVGCRGGGTNTIDTRLLMGRESAIVGVMLLCATEAEWQEMKAALWAGCEKGWVKPVVGKEYPLVETPSAHYDFSNSKGASGSLVLKIA